MPAMLGKLRFDDHYLEEVGLAGDSRVWLRLVRPEDKQLLLDGFRRLSPESRYRRFLAAKNDLTDQELRYLTEVDGRRHFAIGAVERTPDGEIGCGIARFIACDDDPEAAEAAIAVVDSAQGMGLGRVLLERLAAAARERGFTTFRCDVLAENDRMRSLLREMAPNVRETEDGGVVTVELPLPVEQPRPGWFRETALYRFLIQAARGAVRIRDRRQ
jgi:GNAT superfamily N-acetyltransferase